MNFHVKLERIRKTGLSLLCILALLVSGAPVQGFSGPYMPEECVKLTRSFLTRNMTVTAYYADRNNEYQQLSLPGTYYNSLTGENLVLARIENGVFQGQVFSQIYVETMNGVVIGQRAFQNVKVQAVEGSPLKEHTVEFTGGSMKGIEDYAFLSMRTDGDFTIDGIQGSIGEGAFQDAEIGGTFLLLGEIDTIGKNAFRGFRCGDFKIGATVRRMEDGAFRGTEWENFRLGGGVQYLGSGLFEDSALKKLTLPDSNEVKEAAADAFPDREDLTIVVPDADLDLSVYHFDQYQNVVFQIPEDAGEDSRVLQYLKKYHLRYRFEEKGGVVDSPSTEMPTESPLPTPIPPLPPTPTMSPTPTLPMPTMSPTPTPPMPLRPTPSITPTPRITPTPTPTMSPPPTPTPTPPQTPTPLQTVTPLSTVNPAAIPLASALPSSTPAASPVVFVKKKIRYRVSGANRAAVIGTADKKCRRISVPDTVAYRGRLYRVVSIGARAFCGLPACKKITVGNYVKTAGSGAFCQCKNLRRITFGTGLQKLGKKALYRDKRLKKVVFRGDKLQKIGRKTFAGVSKTARITAPKRKAAAYRKMIRRSLQSS